MSRNAKLIVLKTRSVKNKATELVERVVDKYDLVATTETYGDIHVSITQPDYSFDHVPRLDCLLYKSTNISTDQSECAFLHSGRVSSR